MARWRVISLYMILLMVMACTASWGSTYVSHVVDTRPGQPVSAHGVDALGHIVGGIGGYRSGPAAMWGQAGAVPVVLHDNGCALDVSEDGWIVGDYADSEGYDRIFVRNPNGQTSELTELGGFTNFAQDISNSGWVAGYTTFADHNEGFVWSPEVGASYLGSSVGALSIAYGINDGGRAVGSVIGDDGWSRGFVLDPNGEVTLLQTLGGSWGEAKAVSNSGTVVGTSQIDGYLAGVFAWSSEGGMTTAFTYDRSSTTVEVTGMNDYGDVIGYMEHFDLPAHPEEAFVWRADTGMVSLGVGEAFGINNSGQIVGWDGTNAVLWQPVPEPSSLMVLGMGVLPLGGALVRRRRRA
jgi:uncharacterized membrane protein